MINTIFRSVMILGISLDACRMLAEEQNAAKPRETRQYQVMIDQRKAGVHQITTLEDGQRLVVEITANVKVNYFSVYTYIYKFQSREIWEDGQLVEMRVSSLDDGKRMKLNLHRDADFFIGRVNGMEHRTAAADISTAYWMNLDRADRPASVLSVLDVDTGECRPAVWKRIGREAVTAAGKDIACSHYRVDGPSPANLWFDASDRLVLQKSLEDGHAVEIRLTQLNFAKK